MRRWSSRSSDAEIDKKRHLRDSHSAKIADAGDVNGNDDQEVKAPARSTQLRQKAVPMRTGHQSSGLITCCTQKRTLAYAMSPYTPNMVPWALPPMKMKKTSAFSFETEIDKRRPLRDSCSVKITDAGDTSGNNDRKKTIAEQP